MAEGKTGRDRRRVIISGVAPEIECGRFACKRVGGEDVLGRYRYALDAFLLEKTIYELGYELGNRPAWTAIPLHALHQILEIPPA